MASREEHAVSRIMALVRNHNKVVYTFHSHRVDYECGCTLPTNIAEIERTYRPIFCSFHQMKKGWLMDEETVDGE